MSESSLVQPHGTKWFILMMLIVVLYFASLGPVEAFARIESRKGGPPHPMWFYIIPFYEPGHWMIQKTGGGRAFHRYVLWWEGLLNSGVTIPGAP